MVLGGIIEWSTTIGVRGWLLFLVSAVVSGLLGFMAYKFFLSLTHKAISAQIAEYKLTQKSAASLYIPIALSVVVFGVLLISFDVIEIFWGVFIIFMVTLSYLILPLFKRFRPCTVVLSRGKYFVSNSWIGKGLIDTENTYRIEDRYYMGATFKNIYIKDRLVGAIYNVNKAFPE